MCFWFLGRVLDYYKGFWILGSKCFGFWEVFRTLGRVLDSEKCFWILDVFLESGRCFRFCEEFLDSGTCFVPMSHRMFKFVIG